MQTNGKIMRKVRGNLVLEWLKACLRTVSLFSKEARHRDWYTLKTYRAGRAMELAARGFSVGCIQLAGRPCAGTENAGGRGTVR